MIWIDVATPKYAMFFAGMIRKLEKRGFEVLVTTRYAPNYTEAKEILELHQIPHIVLGEYGAKIFWKNLKQGFLGKKKFWIYLKQEGFQKC